MNSRGTGTRLSEAHNYQTKSQQCLSFNSNSFVASSHFIWHWPGQKRSPLLGMTTDSIPRKVLQDSIFEYTVVLKRWWPLVELFTNPNVTKEWSYTHVSRILVSQIVFQNSAFSTCVLNKNKFLMLNQNVRISSQYKTIRIISY